MGSRGDDLDVTVLGVADLGLAVDAELGALADAGSAATWLAERCADARAAMRLTHREARQIRVRLRVSVGIGQLRVSSQNLSFHSAKYFVCGGKPFAVKYV